MRWKLFWAGFFRMLFILYCVEAGAFLVLIPWRDAWILLAGALPSDTLQRLALHHFFRAAVSGFGFVHLIWGIHDLEGILSFRRHIRESRSTSP